MKPTSSFFTGLLAGAAIGGIIALLYAPQSGQETRDQIKKKLDDLEKDFENLKDKVSDKKNDIKDDLLNKLAEIQREIDNLSKQV